MKKSYYYFIMVVSLLLLVNGQIVRAQDMTVDINNSIDVSKPQDVGNKICPVTGEKIDEKTKATYEYEGKIYNFCCVMCIDAFKKDPQKYIKKIEEELQAENKGRKQETKSMSDSMDMHGEHHQ